MTSRFKATGSAGGRSAGSPNSRFVHRQSRWLLFSTRRANCTNSTPFNAWQAFALGLLLLAAGCGSQPPLERPSYDLAKALYAVCNRQSTDGLQKFDTVLAESIADGKVGPNEETALRAIAQVAAAGDWQAAQEQARELIAGQNP